MPLSLRPVRPRDFDLVRHIQVEPHQTLFSGTVRQAFETAEDGVDFHAIFLQSEAIGFFKIDRTHGLAQARELGLRGFMVDRPHQKKGYATQALQTLPDYLGQYYPDQTGLILTVDLQNLIAINLYRNNGFSDSGEMHFGGLFGLQRVMRMPFQITE